MTPKKIYLENTLLNFQYNWCSLKKEGRYDREFISVEELKQHIEEIKELDGKVMTVDVDKLLEFINK